MVCNAVLCVDFGSGKILIEDGLPKWIPGSFGNKKHSSLALSPSPPRSRSASRLSHSLKSVSGELRPEATLVNSNAKASSPRPVVASYDVLASRAAPQRAHSANPAARFRENTSGTRDRAQNEAQLARESTSRAVRTPQVANRSTRTEQSESTQKSDSNPDASQLLLSKSMSNMTVAEIRAALMSMPAMVRHSLVDSNSPKNHQRRATYHSDSPEYPANQSAFNDTQNSSSMHEYYDERGRQDRFQKFSGDRYPAVGEFYANEDRHPQRGSEHSGGRREQENHSNQDYRQVYQSQRDNQGDSTAEYEYEREQEYRQEHHEEQYGEYSGAEETGSEDEDIPEYDPRQEAQERRRTERDFEAQSGYEELEHCGEYDRPQERARSDRRMPQQSRRASAPAGRLQSAAAEYSSTGEDGGNQRRANSKPQLPTAARRSSVSASASSTRQQSQEMVEYPAQRRPTERDNRESHIPRPVEPSPRASTASGAHRRPQPHHQQEDDSSHSLPVWGYRNQQGGRAKSAQRLPSKISQHEQQGKERQHPRPEEAREQDQRSSSAGTTERVRYLPEQQRKETLDWSRKQAAERKLRSHFTSSPVRAVSPGVTPALKLKYRSFNNSVEKDFAAGYEETSEMEGGVARTAPQQRRDASAHRGGQHQDTSAALAQHRSLSASRTNAPPQPPAGGPRESRGTNSGGNPSSGGQRSKSPMFRAFEKKPASFFEFRNARPGSNPRPSAASNGRENEHATPAQGRASGPSSTPIATESFIRSNTQLLANYHNAQRSPGRVDRSAQDVHSTPAAAHSHHRSSAAAASAGAGASNTITNVAEWRRLTDWLSRTGMERYVDVLRINGITKLSLVELMEPQDMKQIGIAAADIPLFQNNVSEFTNRTRSFSEQVLSKTGNTPPASPTTVPPATNYPARNGLPRSNPAVANPVDVPAPVSKPLPQSGHNIRTFAPSLREKERAQRSPEAKRQLTAGAPQAAPSVAPVRNPSSAMTPASFGGSDNEALPETEPAATGLDEHIFSDVDQIRKELHRCFDCGERELFFHAWKQLVLYMPQDCITLNPLHPAFYHAKQVIEFNLHLHFAVYPITHQQGKRAEKAGKLALKRYFESVMVTSEMDALLSGDPSEGGEANKLNASLLSTTPVTSHSFTRSREYATYAGIVLVPEPQENIAFQTLFQPDWMESLKARLEQFLHLMSPNVEIVPTASSSVIAAAEAEMRLNDAAAAGNNENAGDTASVPSVREKVRSFLHVKETAAAPKGTLNDFEIHFSSPVAAQVDPTRESPVLSAIKGTTLEPSSPTDLDMTNKLEQDVVSPLAMSPPADEHATFRKRHIDTKHSDDGVPRISHIASPASPVSSVISQLTDDSHRPIGAAPTQLAAQEATATPTTGLQNSTSARKPKLKPYGSTTKKAMQSQVDMYNKLLKKSRSPTQDIDLAPSLVPFNADQQPEVANTAQKSPDQRAVSESSGSPARRASGSNGQVSQVNKGSSLNVGFGMKRKPASDLPAPDQSLAAQVARYNKLLVKTIDTAEESRELAPASPAAPPPGQSAPSPSRPSEEPMVDNLARSTSSGVETTEESVLSPAEAQQMQDALLEIQNIYTSTDDTPFFGAGVTEKLEAHNLAVAAGVLSDVVEVDLLQPSATQDQVVAE